MAEDKVLIPAKYRRLGLSLGDFACPRVKEDGRLVAHYPIDTEKRTKNAMARFNQPQTVKCKGGREKICSRYRHFGLTDTDAFKEHCK